MRPAHDISDEKKIKYPNSTRKKNPKSQIPKSAVINTRAFQSLHIIIYIKKKIPTRSPLWQLNIMPKMLQLNQALGELGKIVAWL